MDVYDLMEQFVVESEVNNSEKERQIGLVFDRAKEDISLIQSKIETKKVEIAGLSLKAAGAEVSGV